MRALGALLGAVEASSGGNFGVPRCKKKSFRISGSHLNAPRPAKVPQSAPKRAKHEPKRAPKDVEEHLYRGNADLSKSNQIFKQHKGF